MVPYVRKSFYKHFKDGMKYLDGVETTVSFDPNLEINDYEYRYCNKAYKYAIDMTEREIHQAVEAMYHNLK